jgi:uncharacterized protein YbjT (DUF2867 family)
MAKVLITTPNGKVGSELVAQLQKANVAVRLGAHTVEKAKQKFPGAEVVRLDFNDLATVKTALQGVSKAYLAFPTDQDPPAAPFKAFIDEAKAAGVGRIVMLSASGVENAGEAPLRQVELHLERSGVPYTILRSSWFFQNYSNSSAAAVRAGAIAEPADDGKTAFIDTRDVAAAAVAALTQEGHAGKAYALTGPDALDRAQVAAILSKELGRPVKYQKISDREFRAALQGHLKPNYIELLSALYGFIRAGYTAQVTSEVKRILGREPVSFSQFVRDHRAVWA